MTTAAERVDQRAEEIARAPKGRATFRWRTPEEKKASREGDSLPAQVLREKDALLGDDLFENTVAVGAANPARQAEFSQFMDDVRRFAAAITLLEESPEDEGLAAECRKALHRLAEANRAHREKVRAAQSSKEGGPAS